MTQKIIFIIAAVSIDLLLDPQIICSCRVTWFELFEIGGPKGQVRNVRHLGFKH